MRGERLLSRHLRPRPRAGPQRPEHLGRPCRNAPARPRGRRARVPALLVAEHHNMPAVAATNPPVLVAMVAAVTERIRVGSGGVMLPNHAPLVAAEQFALLERQPTPGGSTSESDGHRAPTRSPRGRCVTVAAAWRTTPSRASPSTSTTSRRCSHPTASGCACPRALRPAGDAARDIDAQRVAAGIVGLLGSTRR